MKDMIPMPTPFDRHAKTVRIEAYPLELTIHPNSETQATLTMRTRNGGKRLDCLRVATSNHLRGRKHRWTKYMRGDSITNREQTKLLTELGFNADRVRKNIEASIKDGRTRSARSALTLGIRLGKLDDISDPAITLTTKTGTGTYTLLLVCTNRMNKALTGPNRVQVFSSADSPAVYWWPRLFNGAHIMHLYRTGDYYSASKRGCRSIQALFREIGLNPRPLAALKETQ